MTMTEDQARRIAELQARRSGSASADASSRRDSKPGVRRPKVHAAKKSRYLALGLSVAATSGLVSGMWTQAALSNTAVSAATADTKPVVAETAPQQSTVYIVVHRPSAPGADTLRTTTAPPAVVTPPPAVVAPKPAPAAPAPQPTTKSHGSK
jgi:hypothetical protein